MASLYIFSIMIKIYNTQNKITFFDVTRKYSWLILIKFSETIEKSIPNLQTISKKKLHLLKLLSKTRIVKIK